MIETNAITTKNIDANGMTFRSRVAGDAGEPVMLLHGFPETSHMWIDLMPRLVAAGYRCVAPDQRGYSPDARPAGLDAYRYEALVSDVFALADASGFDRFHLVGHDWGALVGWAVLGSQGAERIASYTSLSIPHALAFARATYEDEGGGLYRTILQLLLTSGGPETAFLANDAAALRGAYTHSTPEQIEDYVAVLSQPGAMTGAANWYRASRAHKRSLEEPDVPFGDVTTPALLIWGKNDPYVRRMSVELAPPHMKGEYRLVEADTGHWIAQEAPDLVAAEVLAHLRAHSIV
ncbi:MAG: alpha/beta fold hydrolase [Dehalococcoidia bacterium]